MLPAYRRYSAAATSSDVATSVVRTPGSCHATRRGVAVGRTSSADGSGGVGAGTTVTSTVSTAWQPVATSVMVSAYVPGCVVVVVAVNGLETSDAGAQENV